MENKRSRKETIKNLYFARRSVNYPQYKEMGGQGNEFEYEAYVHMNKLKANQIEKILEETYSK